MLNSTSLILSLPYAVILFEEKAKENINKWKEQFYKIDDVAGKNNIPLFIVTNSIDEFRQIRKNELRWSEKRILKCDFTAIRSAARANPTLYLLNNGFIEGKWSYADLDKAYKVILKLPAQPAPIPIDVLAPSDTTSSEQVQIKN